MKRNFFYNWRFLLFLWGISVFVGNVEAQTASLHIKTQTEEGQDTVIIRHAKIKSQSPFYMQQRIGVLLKSDSIWWLMPDEVLSFKVGKKRYVSVRMPKEDGGTENVFLRQVYHKPEHEIAVYFYQDSLGNEKRFFEVGNQPLQPLVVGKDGSHPMKEYLQGFPLVEQSDLLKKYVDRMSPDEKSFHKRARICWADNMNLLTRFRWGVSALANINQLTMDKTKVNQTQAAVALWTDVPLGIYGLTLHPELSFNKVSAIQVARQGTPLDIAYNHTMLTLPVMLRYTAVFLKGKVLPYWEGGAFMGYALEHEFTLRGFVRDEDHFVIGFSEEKMEGEQITLGVLAGAGAEIRLMSRHSLWIGARYFKQLDHNMNAYNVSLNGIQLYASFNF